MDDEEKNVEQSSSAVRKMADSFDRYFAADEENTHSHSLAVSGNNSDIARNKNSDITSISKSNDAFIHLRNEIAELKLLIQEKETELVTSRSRNYELTKKIEKLKAENEALRTSKRHSINSNPKHQIAESRGLLNEDVNSDSEEDDDTGESSDFELDDETKTTRRKTRKIGKKKGRRRKGRKYHQKTKRDVEVDSITVHPKKHARIPGKDFLSLDADRFYGELASLFPKMRLAAIIDVENKFLQADQNDDGMIDADELEKMLTTSQTMFTRKEVIEVIKEFDKDDTGTLDFIEALSVMDLMERNMNTKIPLNLKRQKSAICAVQ
ncbi:uncharacterized protein LOC141915477 [Tubulanus polymorphus]|uniref:uncharacterized protein LOC141915477 n=1 Tax=Tubulanus polymorphus TaxID=672921 RepID=UPI003DA2C313